MNLLVSAKESLFDIAQQERLNNERHDRGRFFFFLTLLFYSAYMALMQSGWVFSGEMWAEMATNYFLNAQSVDLSQQLFATDYGYIPLLQRLLALFAQSLGAPAEAIPYYYTWSAILLSAALVGSFCLPIFRYLISSDVLRFLCSISVLLIADFETRTFINFTYFGVFFITILLALSLARPDIKAPWWAWIICLLALSKPVVFAAIPMLMVVAAFSKGSFRIISIVTVVLCVFQLYMILNSHSAGTHVSTVDFSWFQKCDAALRYGLGFLGSFIFGRPFIFEHPRPLICGGLVLGIIAMTLFRMRTPANALIVAGLSLILFNAVLFSFTLTEQWNIAKLDMLRAVPLYRHTVVAFSGCILVAAGWIATVTNSVSLSEHRGVRLLPPAIFLLWFVFSGWASFSAVLNKMPLSPTLNSSQWQNMAEAIDGNGPICVPINPMGWAYRRDCTNLSLDLDRSVPYGYKLATQGSGNMQMPVPASILGRHVLSLAVLVKSTTTGLTSLKLTVVLKLKSGAVSIFSGDGRVPLSGGVLLLTADAPVDANLIESASLQVKQPTQIGYFLNDPANTPAMTWYGY
ncbi:hypothetical protein [Pseudomonas typographi]|uniref:DUF2029 domain-containing protein n=1 Tax=Pseudomonas typographi TaxID=2715964 RepID=A0ABR7Z8Y9_9PSED|nr:hypothetical protein [Pseudomonas typographi]MBD1553264.1 hypothetical protein [Pseudomonas typographi]MBD1602011.1 hypothetical protein [Pseudomonas typographi]